jgi:glutathione S-transferase
MYTLFIANKNYSSWSLRPWLLMRALQIPFEEVLLTFGDAPAWAALRARSGAGKVPCLVDGEVVVWDSLAIVEYLAERHAGVWPSDPIARAWARCAAAEMHSSFTALRSTCSMNVGVRVRLHARPPALERDLERLTALWGEGLARFGGPYLAGASFSAVDAFFAPVAFRMQTYHLDLGPVANAYAERLRAHPDMIAWAQAGLAETTRDRSHDDEIRAAGELVEDLRAR